MHYLSIFHFLFIASELLKDLRHMTFKSRDSPEEETPDENASLQAVQAEKGVLADRYQCLIWIIECIQ